MMKNLFFIAFFCLLFFMPDVLSGQVTDMAGLDRLVDGRFADLRTVSGPVIGISGTPRTDGGSTVSGSYIQAVEKAGGIPLVIPVIADGEAIRRLLEQIDGLVMTGGSDVAPSFYNEGKWNETVEIDSLRDVFDLMLIRMAGNRNIPILGICRGAQLVNVAFGGSLYQDLPTQVGDTSVHHRQTVPMQQASHSVSIVKGTMLGTILGRDSLRVNSYHHQAVKEVAPLFRIAAKSTDGIVEAIEAYPNRAICGVQWHPESLVDKDTSMLQIYQQIVKRAALYKKAKEIHRHILALDTHSDTPLNFIHITGYDFSKREKNQVNLPKMEEGRLDGIFLAAYIGQGKRDDASLEKAVRHVETIIDSIYTQVGRNKDLCDLAVTGEDLARLKEEGKKAVFIGIENGYGIGKTIGNLKKFRDKGVDYMTLCHTRNNDICDSSSDSIPEWGGLSPFGRKVVREMNRLGMIIDLSHAHENTFWAVLKASKMPVVVTHSSVRALCDHDRNLTDRQMTALAEKGGVMQLCPVDEFISENIKEANLDQFMDHLDYAVKLMGIDHVGIGSDFDGGGGLIGLRGANDMVNITVKLIERGYNKEEIAKIWGGNFLRVLADVQAGRVK
ncbi:membrane dipeptidase [Parabacteroides sp. Marseille-P3160]|uniref:membrane dipeptidase n=1 Tax=Parabacteroides sp. Marseille-P3160 TaxID=1917887 RepID=UPI001F229119|nr:membrane dipeptidase [Parabacteroides sp. Marseille-P3160]